HNLEMLDLKPVAAGFSAVIYGHSHVHKQEMKNNVLYFNPGAAGPRRFKLPVSVGKLVIRDGGIGSEIKILDAPSFPLNGPFRFVFGSIPIRSLFRLRRVGPTPSYMLRVLQAADLPFRNMTTRGGIIIGVISDTHGMLRGEVRKVFEHAEYILHAG